MNTTVLIVEDEGLIALDMKNKLEQAGYSVCGIADCAEEAIASVERFLPSLVMMDIRLRGAKDGIETAAEIRERFHVPVIFVTAHADYATLDRARITEPFGYIVKPFQSINFRAQIEMALWKHQMEQKLRVSERWFSATFESISDALIATDSEGKVTFVNLPAAALTGWERAEALGRPLTEVFSVTEDGTGRHVTTPLHQIPANHETGSETRAFRLTTRGLAGTVPIEASISANCDNGSMFGIVVVFRDVTARRAAERKDRQAQRASALGLMATGLGRELTESQNQMDASLQQLIEQSRGSTQRLLWDVFERSAQQQSIVQQLVTLGKGDEEQAGAMDLNGVVTELESKFRKILGVRRPLHLHLQAGSLPICVNLRNLRDNLLRLVTDSRKATPDGGPVTITTSVAMDEDETREVVQLTLRDTRKTTRTEAGERVFDPYYQSSPGNSNPGLSLALVYHFMALSGGSIHAENMPGQGSAYRLVFPVAELPLTLEQTDQQLAASA